MKNTLIKHHAYFLGLSGLMLLLVACISVVATRFFDKDGYHLPTIDPNSAYFLGLRLLVYGAILVLGKRCIYRIFRAYPSNNKKKNVSLFIAHGYRTAVYLLLYALIFELLIVQQGWVMLIQGLWR